MFIIGLDKTDYDSEFERYYEIFIIELSMFYNEFLCGCQRMSEKPKNRRRKRVQKFTIEACATF